MFTEFGITDRISAQHEGGNHSTKRNKLQNGKFPQIESA